MSEDRQDFERKLGMLRSWLADKDADALLLTTVANFAWLCHGRSFVSIASEASVARLLITMDRVLILTGSNELPRIEKEELSGWGLEFLTHEWHEGFAGSWSRSAFAKLRVVIDREVEAELSILRSRLSPRETGLLLELGRDAAELLEGYGCELRPGQSEFAIAGEIARRAWERGIEPLVLNIATDERAFSFRHAIPSAKRLERYAVISLCLRRRGLHVTLTRSVHFGAAPPELVLRHRVACEIEALAQARSLHGAKLADLAEAALADYARLGWPEEWRAHPIGGCVGFQPREYDLVPGMPGQLAEGQAFCWNPTILGTKSEETFIVSAEGSVPATRGRLFPTLSIDAGVGKVERPAILER